MGERIKTRLKAMAERNDITPITGIRGHGAMIGFDIVKSRGSYEPDADATKRVTAAALDQGLILLSCGVFGNVIRILVPLTAGGGGGGGGLGKLEAALVAGVN
jgi:4-aminobutyrate aminotransferase/(S)-3-amino-2-methylpropionate transaminase